MIPLKQFERSGLVFDVRDGGSPDGEPVVLLHGFPQDSTSWDAVARGLAAAGLRTLAPDLRGYSPGARPQGRKAYCLGQCADDLLALLDAAGLESAHIVGHDWGGALAWYVAGRDPRRVRSLTVLSTPHPAAMRRAWVTSSQGLKSWYMVFFQLPVLPEFYLTASPARVAQSLESNGLPRDYAKRYARRLAEPDAARAALGWYRAIPFALGDSFQRTAVPTTYIWGRNDSFLGRAAAEATARYVTADYRFMESDGGHWLPETRSAETIATVLERVAMARS